ADGAGVTIHGGIDFHDGRLSGVPLISPGSKEFELPSPWGGDGLLIDGDGTDFVAIRNTDMAVLDASEVRLQGNDITLGGTNTIAEFANKFLVNGGPRVSYGMIQASGSQTISNVTTTKLNNMTNVVFDPEGWAD